MLYRSVRVIVNHYEKLVTVLESSEIDVQVYPIPDKSFLQKMSPTLVACNMNKFILLYDKSNDQSIDLLLTTCLVL